MRRAILIAILALAVPGAATDETETVEITYDVVAVQGKLLLEIEPEPKRLEEGDHAVSGDRLRTGSSSSSTIGVPTHTAVFRIEPKTSCTLAYDRPGVLLHIEKGRVRAMFGEYAGDDPRLVTTPSAVLAVRGTDYGVKVKKNGETRVVVFEGVVEMIDPTGVHPPTRIRAGEQTRVRSGRAAEAPSPHRLSPMDWDRGRMAPGNSGYGADPGRVPGAGSFGSGAGANGSGSGSGGGSGSKRRGG
jgi:hypothetical protein